MDLANKTIKKLGFKLKERDIFECEGYMYSQSKDSMTYQVAGRYHVHTFDKNAMKWDILLNQRNVCKNVADRRREKLRLKKS